MITWERGFAGIRRGSAGSVVCLFRAIAWLGLAGPAAGGYHVGHRCVTDAAHAATNREGHFLVPSPHYSIGSRDLAGLVPLGSLGFR